MIAYRFSSHRTWDVAQQGGQTPLLCKARIKRDRRGFTLLEVVLSLSLSVLLLGAIFTALDQSWRLSASGREEMERSQLARALLSQIAADVRSVAFVSPPVEDESSTSSGSSTSSSGSSSSGSSGSSNSSSSSPSSSSSTSASSSVTPVSLISIGIRGDANRIEMHISRPRRDLDFTPGMDGSKLQTRSSDLIAVQYHLATTGTGASGLVRTEGDRLTILTMESKGGTADAASKQQVLAPEVASLHFRYFDGKMWYPYWVSGGPVIPEAESTSGSSTTSASGGSTSGSGSNSSSNSSSSGSSSSGTTMTTSSNSSGMGRVPRAIEVTIGLAPPQIPPGPLLRVGISSSVNTFRTVIVIPISDPLPAEFIP